MEFTQQVNGICLITGVTEYTNGMTFTRQVYEICLITGVTKYANGMDFRCFQGGFFLPRELHSGEVKTKIKWENQNKNQDNPIEAIIEAGVWVGNVMVGAIHIAYLQINVSREYKYLKKKPYLRAREVSAVSRLELLSIPWRCLHRYTKK